MGDAHPKLADHSGQFNQKEILTVRDRVHVAIGFGLANCILIEGELSPSAWVKEVKFRILECWTQSYTNIFGLNLLYNGI